MMRLSSTLRRYRWAVFAVWLLLLVPSIYLGLGHGGQLTGGGFEVEGSQSLRVQRELEEHFPDQGASPLALVAAPRADASYEDMNVAVAHLERVAAEVPSVKAVPTPRQPPPQPDRPYVVTLELDFDNTGAVDVAKQLREKVGVDGEDPGEIANGKVKLYVIGQGALGAAASQATKHDIAQAERWNLPIVLIILLAVFGSLAAAAMPLLLGICTVVVTMGLVYLLSMVTTMSVFVTSTVSMFGIAVAIDYSLFILMRFREELRAGRDADQAADAAMATSGLAVVLSGVTVIASVTGIYLIATPVLESMATGAILAVAVAVLTSTTLTPAVLATFGRRAAKRSSYLHWSRRPETTQSRFWTRWTGQVMRRPWLSALTASALLLILAFPAFSMVLGNSMQRQFEPTHEIRGGVNAAAEALGPGALGPVRVLVSFPDGNAASAPSKEPVLESIRQRMAQGPNVISVTPPVFGEDYRHALLSAVLSVDPEDMAARDAVNWMRAELPNTPGLDGARIDVGGPTALIKDFDDRVAATQPLVFVFVALIAFVMLLVAIRSPVLAAKGVLMTVLSVAAAYGSLVAVFQWGWLEVLGFAPISSLDSTIPPLVLAIAFGLSMDYEIFLLTRIRERYLQTHNTRDAVAYGVSTSARTITSAALIMIAVFIGFAFAGMPLVAQLGVACAVAIAVDATVVRLVLVPALMAMFDEWNWWLPRWLDRILPSVDFEKPLPKVDTPDLVIIPDDISSLGPSGSDLRTVVKSAARLKTLAPHAVTVSDPLALSGCEPVTTTLRTADVLNGGHRNGAGTKTMTGTALPVHPVTLWRGRLAVALDALEAASDYESAVLKRCSPVETTNVQLPTGDRLQIPTCAETLRLKGYLIMCRNSARDFAEFAELVDGLETRTAALVLGGMDRYYAGEQARQQWVATQLVRRLADPQPSDEHDTRMSGPEAETDWARVRQRCLSVAVAMLEEAR
ncbi:MMPL family transporter [Mycolicibacterium holsaticum]|uniref:MMPL family transporter n=1 Tax=Mycolicibacterium holsaticum TaxID=152142 RepID=UPI001C7CB5D8|nr:MMPL family transporter [Mycolicibacterium holsaticum]MDA4108863.1 membrane protein [Mycolicibacterium holsaticum DSM 44478 = JCM 12374]QZA12438.1 MMPL family transporter [Mycolicibacterium holsaticum DSM 44478 = JCM 12374]UNC10080.1 MMPL family transporter [Mycolicibacterium holsaticum DSM 44478 = JCM 12374]